MAAIDVQALTAQDGWRFRVRVDDGDGTSEHEVTLGEAERKRFRADADPAELVKASFPFLLEREPKEAILGRFALGDIARYFPDYRTEIQRRL